jgi:xanthine dehydrogenase accessory factor
LQAYLDQQQAVILATVISGPADLIGGKLLVAEGAEPTGNLTDPVLRPAVQAQARRLLYHERSVAKDFGRARVFFDVYAPPPKLIVVGAVHIAIPLVVFAKEAGFQTVVVDPRTAFATPERFPQVDQLIHLWPDEALPQVGLTPNTYVVLLTHDPKLDDPALMVALPSKVAYVGALGSKKTHAKRVARLRQAGLTEDEIAGLHAPIGLDLGARTPAEIALSVIAEIVMIRRQAETRAAGDDN